MSEAKRPKRYDRAYFDRWYRSGKSRIEGNAALRRRVALAVAITERYLERPIRSALDVGCGEARWRAELLRLRPKLTYRGIEPSEYAVERYGKSRQIVRGGVADLPALGLHGPFDLVICADVLHYLNDAELRSAVPELARRTAGAAYLEVLTSEEEIEGDKRALNLRSSALYRQLFAAAGLTDVGSHIWLSPGLAEVPAALERR
ncbi:MAG: methyltransferase [Thermoanaerobaculia bacterium]